MITSLPNKLKAIVLPFLLLPSLMFAQNLPSLSVLKQYVSQHKTKLEITDKDIETLQVVYQYKDDSTGIQHIYSTQKLNGLTITNTNFALHFNSEMQTDANRLIALAKYKILPVIASVSATEAVAKLMNVIGYTVDKKIELKQPATGTDRYTIFKRNGSSVWDIPLRLVYYNNSRLKTLIPAWEVQMMDVKKQHYWLAYIDASTGIVLEKKDLIIHCIFDGNVTDANNRTFRITGNLSTNKNQPEDLSLLELESTQSLPDNTYRVYNLPYESPIDPGAKHSLSSKSGNVKASPDGWHKVGNLITYNYTHGNNVWAFQDPSPGPLGGVPSADPTRTSYPTNTTAGVYPLTEPFVFDYKINLNNEPETYMHAAIVNLFYWNNLMHDVFYYMGFDEAAGNFQESNTFSTGTRGGSAALGNDEVLAQAQDGGGTNNANFLTLPDGTNGQMQMYLWTASFPDSLVQISSSTSGTPRKGKKFISVQGSFSTLPTANNNLYTNPVVNKELGIVQKNPLSIVGGDTEGCSTGQQSVALPAQNVNGKIALIDRGNCSFAEKVLGAQSGGAVGVIIINNVDGPPLAMGGTDAPANAITIPAVMISKADGEILKSQIRNGATIIGSLKRDYPPAPKRDGDIDNGVISHEYGHGISNRLTGGPSSLSPLGGDEQGGEGWSDFVALYMTLRKNDLSPATAQHPFGVLPVRSIGNYVTYQNYDGRGIREYPYSIDMSVNPATFAYVKRSDYSETHSVGFVWCSMLYELLQNFIDEYGMNDYVYQGANPTKAHNPPSGAKGNNIATRLVIEAMKLQPVSPTFIEERDAILKADSLLYNAQHSCMIWKAFAKRGLGYSASSGTNALGDEVEAFDVPFSCDPSQTRINIVKAGPILINNSSNQTYTITVKNIYPAGLSKVIVRDTLASAFAFVSSDISPVINGKIITWKFSLAANASKTIKVTVKCNSSVVSSKRFADNQENGTAKWQAETSATAQWTYSNDALNAFSKSHYWFIPDYDIGGSNTSLSTASKIYIPKNAVLVFYHKFATESNYDGGVVEVSLDGSNWFYLPPSKFQRGNYTGIIATADNPNIGTADAAAFTGSTNGYIQSMVKLDDYKGKKIFIRFRMVADPLGGSVEGGGWWIDDVIVLSNPTEITNTATAITKAGKAITETEGTNAFATTRAFIIGSASTSVLTASAEQQSIDLSWNVESDVAASAFDVERRAPGTSTFTKIGVVIPSASQLEAGEFGFTDKNPLTGISEYRIKKIISGEQASYTNIAAAKIGRVLTAGIFPNPAEDFANLSIQNPSEDEIFIYLFDALGKKLATFNAGKINSKIIALPVQQLKAGTYWIEVRTAQESKTLQLIKK